LDLAAAVENPQLVKVVVAVALAMAVPVAAFISLLQ